VIIVADHTKFGRGGMIPVAPLTAAHIVVSDAELGSEYVMMLRGHGIEVLLA
jgi:DeoR/GlpR family transcriptional regulator of sugar metabolism